MKYSYALPALAAFAAQAIAAPVVVTNTEVVYVTADAVTVAPTSSSVGTPQVGNVLEVVVSELVIVSGATTYTETSTFTRTAGVATSTSASATTASTEATTTDASTTPSTTPSTSAPSTTTLAPSSTTSTTPTSTSTSSTSTTPTSTSTSSTSTSTTSTPTSTSTSSTSTSSTSTSSTATSSSTLSTFASAILDEHNAKRALHGVDDLTWSETLAAYAQAYADKYDCSGTLTHSGGAYGENLALGYSTTGAVDAWYNEIDDYDWSNPSASHFTQVVWKSSTQLGCGYTTCGSYWGQYTICSYNPAGNVAGEYSENVLALV